jgi:hypothetical protein
MVADHINQMGKLDDLSRPAYENALKHASATAIIGKRPDYTKMNECQILMTIVLIGSTETVRAIFLRTNTYLMAYTDELDVDDVHTCND